MHKLRSGKQRISVIVSIKPVQAGVDPRNLLIDIDMYDNMKAIKEVRSLEKKAIVKK